MLGIFMMCLLKEGVFIVVVVLLLLVVLVVVLIANLETIYWITILFLFFFLFNNFLYHSALFHLEQIIFWNIMWLGCFQKNQIVDDDSIFDKSFGALFFSLSITMFQSIVYFCCFLALDDVHILCAWKKTIFIKYVYIILLVIERSTLQKNF